MRLCGSGVRGLSGAGEQQLLRMQESQSLPGQAEEGGGTVRGRDRDTHGTHAQAPGRGGRLRHKAVRPGLQGLGLYADQ